MNYIKAIKYFEELSGDTVLTVKNINNKRNRITADITFQYKNTKIENINLSYTLDFLKIYENSNLYKRPKNKTTTQYSRHDNK